MLFKHSFLHPKMHARSRLRGRVLYRRSTTKMLSELIFCIQKCIRSTWTLGRENSEYKSPKNGHRKTTLVVKRHVEMTTTRRIWYTMYAT
jgi:hypothetical protein